MRPARALTPAPSRACPRPPPRAPARKHIPGFERKAFKGEALGLYRRVCALLAAGERSELRALVTPAVWTDMKRQLKQREDGGWARVQWDLVRVRRRAGRLPGGAVAESAAAACLPLCLPGREEHAEGPRCRRCRCRLALSLTPPLPLRPRLPAGAHSG